MSLTKPGELKIYVNKKIKNDSFQTLKILGWGMAQWFKVLATNYSCPSDSDTLKTHA